jgi:hypothetical protein
MDCRAMGQLGLVKYTPGQVSKLPNKNRLAGARRGSVALRATLFITAQARGIATLYLIVTQNKKALVLPK